MSDCSVYASFTRYISSHLISLNNEDKSGEAPARESKIGNTAHASATRRLPTFGWTISSERCSSADECIDDVDGLDAWAR